MLPTIFLLISLVVLCLTGITSFIISKRKHKINKWLTSTNLIFAGVVIMAVILFIPIYLDVLNSSDGGLVEAVLISIHNMIRLFIVDGEFTFVLDNLGNMPDWVARGYSLVFSVLFVVAPLLTFGFVLSFFKNISAYKKYITNYRSEVFIFSELNYNSLELAHSLYDENHRKRLFIFTDVFEKDEEQSYEMMEKAKEIGAIFFKNDIVTINFSFHSKKSTLNFFAIGEDQAENINQGLKLLNLYADRDNTNLYIFSTQIESEILLTNAINTLNARKDENGQQKSVKVKLRRIDEVSSLINRNMYESGYEKVFCTAHENAQGEKEINAVVVGMGKHGTEMTKTLSWLCQMDGYKVQINCFDADKKAEDKFLSLCPELMDPKFNGNFEDNGEAKYKIDIHSDVDVDTKTFDDLVTSLPWTTYVFVSLGNDEKNIFTAVKLRMLFERIGYTPVIQTVVKNSEKKEALSRVTNFRNRTYNIDFIGDVKDSYSASVIIRSDVENKALQRHLKWGDESDFWNYSYNYRSSVASVIHSKMKILCKIPGADKLPTDRTTEELWNIRRLEHRRWNTYMRSEGYMFSGSLEKSSRNDLAKQHHCLVPFDKLSKTEQEKDDD